MAMVVVMAALVGAGLWFAIRVENGLDARPRPGRGPVRSRRCTDGRKTTGRGRPVRAARCRSRKDAGYPAAIRSARRADSAVSHGVRGTAGPACAAPDGRAAREPSRATGA